MMIALVLLTIFRFLDEKLTEKDQVGLKASNSFVQEIINLLIEEREHRSVKIFASTAVLYFPAIRESKVKIEHLKVLLRDPNKLDTAKLPFEKEEQNRLSFEIQGVIHNLKTLQAKGRISKISFGFYDFPPTFHCMIIDEKSLYFGFYGISSDHPGPELTYVATRNSIEGLSFLSDFKAKFDNIWSVYGQQQSS